MEKRANKCIFWHFLENFDQKNCVFLARTPLKIIMYWRQRSLKIVGEPQNSGVGVSKKCGGGEFFESAAGRIPDGTGEEALTPPPPPTKSAGGYKYKITVSFSSLTN